MEKVNTFGELVTANIKWLLVLAFIISGLFLDSVYETKADSKLLKDKITALEKKVDLYINTTTLANTHHTGELNTLSGRVDKKIELINDGTKKLNEIENEMIRQSVYIELMWEDK